MSALEFTVTSLQGLWVWREFLPSLWRSSTYWQPGHLSFFTWLNVERWNSFPIGESFVPASFLPPVFPSPPSPSALLYMATCVSLCHFLLDTQGTVRPGLCPRLILLIEYEMRGLDKSESSGGYWTVTVLDICCLSDRIQVFRRFCGCAYPPGQHVAGTRPCIQCTYTTFIHSIPVVDK